MRAAVVGHVEWVEFVRVPALPASGAIVHATEWWEEPAGGGPVAAVQLSRLGADTTFFTALGDDGLGHRAQAELEELGLDVRAVFRDEPTRRAITYVDDTRERTITVLGERLAPRRSDDLPWDELADCDCAYFTAGDAECLKTAREAKVVVATARVLSVLQEAAVELDAVVGSSVDAGERFTRADLNPPALMSVWTEGESGGRYAIGDDDEERYSPFELQRPVVDRYGAGDAFAAGLTFALGRGRSATEALSIGARCGAAALQGRGPYEGQYRAR